MTTCKLSDIVTSAFSAPHRALKSGEVNQLVLKGGRGSAKSSYASVEGIQLLIRNPEIHAAVMRKVGNTLRTSVYSQYRWAISALGLDHLFKATTSPMELTYLPTGQKIFFFGADDPGKLKSIKVPFGYIGYLHFEELDQFGGEEEVRNIEQSILRGGPLAYEIKSFNPPQSRENWANKYCLTDKPGQLIHHSTYQTTPEAWLGERFLADAEHLKKTKPRSYEHEYLGVANGTGGAVFDNVVIRKITAQERSQFDQLRRGVDWGFAVDPFVYGEMHYDSTRRMLYLLDEVYEVGLSNRKAIERMRAKGRRNIVITADSAEPKSIAECVSAGLNMVGAKKGPDSVEYGIKFLQDMAEIVVDPDTCPNAAREFIAYEYARNKDGTFRSGYPDINNHWIDTARYALEEDMANRYVRMHGGKPAGW